MNHDRLVEGISCSPYPNPKPNPSVSLGLTLIPTTLEGISYNTAIALFKFIYTGEVIGMGAL